MRGPGGAGSNVKWRGQPFQKLRQLLLSHNFSGRQYLLNLYCMDTRLLVTIMGRQTTTLILSNLFVAPC